MRSSWPKSSLDSSGILGRADPMTQPQTFSSEHVWAPDSWQRKPAAQQPVYPDQDAFAKVVAHLAKLPPLVTSWEVEALKQELAKAARGECFLLQGGDCAESFEDCEPVAIV